MRYKVCYKTGDRAIFLFGFAKNEQDNINLSELKDFKEVGNILLALTEKKLQKAIIDKELFNLKD
jgi:hypothetical protein